MCVGGGGGGGGGGGVVIVVVDSGITRLHNFLAGVRDMVLRVPSPSGAAKGVCDTLSRMKKKGEQEVGEG